MSPVSLASSTLSNKQHSSRPQAPVHKHRAWAEAGRDRGRLPHKLHVVVAVAVHFSSAVPQDWLLLFSLSHLLSEQSPPLPPPLPQQPLNSCCCCCSGCCWRCRAAAAALVLLFSSQFVLFVLTPSEANFTQQIPGMPEDGNFGLRRTTALNRKIGCDERPSRRNL